MPINKVPKFVQQRMAEKRREKKKVGHDIVKGSSFSGFESAKKKYEHKNVAKIAKEESIAQGEQKKAESKQLRKKEGKLFRKKNERGQPNMGSQLELLLSRFNR